MGREAGHTFLARLGKKRLRPGGVEATSWLINNGYFKEDKKVLEVACNMGTTMVELGKWYKCEIKGVDLDEAALEKARANIKANKLDDKLSVAIGDATNLDFPDESFDIVINEAMLTMLPKNSKIKAIQEYYRVLKKGGILLTQDVSIVPPFGDVVKDLQRSINVPAIPLETSEWEALYKEAGFSDIQMRTGKMSLLSPYGLIIDEGPLGTLKIIKNAMKSENRKMFMNMFKTFRKYKKTLNFVAFCCKK